MVSLIINLHGNFSHISFIVYWLLVFAKYTLRFLFIFWVQFRTKIPSNVSFFAPLIKICYIFEFSLNFGYFRDTMTSIFFFNNLYGLISHHLCRLISGKIAIVRIIHMNICLIAQVRLKKKKKRNGTHTLGHRICILKSTNKQSFLLLFPTMQNSTCGCVLDAGHRIHQRWGIKWFMLVPRIDSRENWTAFHLSCKPLIPVSWAWTL